MKKLTIIAVCAFAISMVSCKKEQTCTCTTTIDGQSISASTTIKDTKSKAKEACEKGNSSVLGIVTKCEIK